MIIGTVVGSIVATRKNERLVGQKLLIIRPLENDKFEMVSVGPTTSMQMKKFEYEFRRKKVEPVNKQVGFIK